MVLGKDENEKHASRTIKNNDLGFACRIRLTVTPDQVRKLEAK